MLSSNYCDYIYKNYLAHSGVPGMKWGKRRFQNEDGTLTEEGKLHYQRLQNNSRLAVQETSDEDRELSNQAITRETSEVPEHMEPTPKISSKSQQETQKKLNDLKQNYLKGNGFVSGALFDKIFQKAIGSDQPDREIEKAKKEWKIINDFLKAKIEEAEKNQKG